MNIKKRKRERGIKKKCDSKYRRRMSLFDLSISKENDKDEFLLEKDRNRFVMFPIKHHDIYQKYLDAQSTFWTAEEIDLSQDEKDWTKLTEDER